MSACATAHKFRQVTSLAIEVGALDEEDVVLGKSKDEDEKRLQLVGTAMWQSQCCDDGAAR